MSSQLSSVPNDKAAAEKAAKIKEELGRLVGRLQGLKRKLDTADAREEAALARIDNRIASLRSLNPDEPDPADSSKKSQTAAALSAARRDWSKKRVDRLVADHLAREGHVETAAALAAQLDGLVDMEAFDQARPVLQGLRRRDVGPALAWCQENRVRLRKAESTLELRLRIQELIEMSRREETEAAIAYARKHLAPAAKASLPEVKRCMTALALGPDTRLQAYGHLYHASRWTELIESFKQESFQLMSMPVTSPLLVTLQAGLGCLKSAACAEGAGANGQCPTCHPLLRKLAEPLPVAHHMHSRLLCGLSGRVMDEHDPPYVLPNGSVYSYQALTAMAAGRDGLVTDPKTMQEFLIADARKAFIS